MATDMETWAHDIVASHKWRESALSAIRKETAELLEEFRRQSSERRSEIFQMLGGFRKERLREAAAWHDIIGTLYAKTKKEARHGRGKKSEKSSSE